MYFKLYNVVILRKTVIIINGTGEVIGVPETSRRQESLRWQETIRRQGKSIIIELIISYNFYPNGYKIFDHISLISSPMDSLVSMTRLRQNRPSKPI